jgi:acetyl-CoA carboxylase biotin carboxyl carrier protein
LPDLTAGNSGLRWFVILTGLVKGDSNIKQEVMIMANMESPLAGKILEVNVKVGQQVTEDDEIMIIESMKMENPLFSPNAGTVKEIRVKVGDRVSEGDILAIVE